MSFGRITNLMVSNSILGEINQSQDTMDGTEEELSTGYSINEPSDNPYGAGYAVQLNGQLSSLTNYASNITDGQGWTQSATTAIDTIQSAVQQAQEYATEAANETSNSPATLADLGNAISGLVSTIQSAAASQYNGQYVFSGTSTSTAPYDGSGTYQGSTSMVTRAIGPGATATVSVNLSTVLGVNSSSGLLSQLSTMATQLQAGDNSQASSDITEMQTGLGQLAQLQEGLGTTTDQLSMASSTLTSMQTSLTSELSNDEDANMASTYTAYSNEQAAFTAALKAGASIVQTSLMDFLSN